MNQYPLWKYLLVAVVMIVGCLYALPNLYGDSPAVAVSLSTGKKVGTDVESKVREALNKDGLAFSSIARTDQAVTVRFAKTDTQLKAEQALHDALGNNYVVALNLVPAAPAWLTSINALPMYLGLDLRGGVHFLMQVDMDAAVKQAKERYIADIRDLLRSQRIRYEDVAGSRQADVVIHLRSAADLEKTRTLLGKEYPNLVLAAAKDGEAGYVLRANVSPQEVKDTRDFALEQNITTLRNRVNELGVAEPVIQRQGVDRIVVELPGVQDPARAKEILGATATLEFRLVDTQHDVQQAVAGQVPPGSRLYYQRGTNTPILLQKQVIVTGNQIIDAGSGFDQRTGEPDVNVTLDGNGARKMGSTTQANIGRPMAVVYIEHKSETHMVGGKSVRTTKEVQQVINVATIQDAFSKRFQITGLDSSEEARNLALLLRAGALAAPIDIIEERTVGPSLGAQNIAKGFASTLIGFAAIIAFMTFYYRVFGLIASVALFGNLVLLIALLSMLQATLTLPGIAGIALTIGMAIDANVLIFERIREELRNGVTPQTAIHVGYNRAWGTILDSNISIFIAGLALFLLGSGPIRGFAVVLCLGILTSMFSAVLVSRSMVNLIYGARRLHKLAI